MTGPFPLQPYFDPGIFREEQSSLIEQSWTFVATKRDLAQGGRRMSI